MISHIMEMEPPGSVLAAGVGGSFHATTDSCAVKNLGTNSKVDSARFPYESLAFSFLVICYLQVFQVVLQKFQFACPE